MSFCQLDSLLPGHPKILLNKGRLGWGKRELSQFSPESGKLFRPFWCAVKKERATCSDEYLKNEEALLRESLSESDLTKMREQLEKKGLLREDYHFFPVHPWQWERFICIQYFSLIVKKELVGLGEAGDFYRPQTSLRTLSNESRPLNKDIKLPLSILNTSCVRGVGKKYIQAGAKLGQALEAIIEEDAFFQAMGEKAPQVAKDCGGISVRLDSQEKIEGGLYRYREMLGAIWRESVQAKEDLNNNKEKKKIISTAALCFEHIGESYIEKVIEKSGLKAKDWIREYFQVVVIPLYRLQMNYGVGLVSHGQNILLGLKDFRPSFVLLKDFHGDLRVTEKSPLRDDADILPEQYLIHDLITGHFVTLLRYLSRKMAFKNLLSEEAFYFFLGEVLANYLKGQGLNEKKLAPSLNLLRKEYEKVLVNKVRFIIGYQETHTRPKPLLGKPILNPIYQNYSKGKGKSNDG